MKTRRIFKGSWFFLAALIAVVLGELIAAWVTQAFALRNNPFLVGVVSVGLVAFAAAILYPDSDFE